ncbi:hypothetical protein DFQ27_001753 [Actinomortierella ambigua]|uniref:CBS domain-containing protein n=1 Tax=Actinomortierella ambigua TaxID=1343610 RepID=A0A9P6QE16_9FUNG|nr:hypothetical protein DFQ27_001753 [Actinomortierella ambigua]
MAPPIRDSVGDAVGDTPVVRLRKSGASEKIELLAKLEFNNPGGSIKDRVARRILSRLAREQKLKDSTVLVVPSSGNLVLSLALQVPRYVPHGRVIGLVPERTSEDRIRLLKSLGVDIVRTPVEAHADSPESKFSLAKKITADLPDAILINEYADIDNVRTHAEETAEEILEQTEGKLDILVVGAETGGTISGLAKTLKAKIPGLKVIGVEPEHSSIRDNVTRSGVWRVEDMGSNFTPSILDQSLVDKWLQIPDQVSYSTARLLIKHEGLLCGPSSGGVVAAALHYADEALEVASSDVSKLRVLTILNDTARNYTSTLMSDDWLLEHDLMDATLARAAAYHRHEKYRAASVEDLQLPAAVTIPPTATVGYAMDLMMTREFSQLPVIHPTNRKLMGYISQTTLTNLLEEGQAHDDDQVSKWMYSFVKKQPGLATPSKYVTITPLTPLAELAQFFEKHSFAVVTDEDRRWCLGVATKYDLMTFLNRRQSSGRAF